MAAPRLDLIGLLPLLCFSTVVAQPANDPPLPKEIHSAVAKDLGLADDDDCLKENGLRLEDQIRTTWLQLGSKVRGLLIEGLGPCNAGANNGPMLIYAHVDGAWKKVFDQIANHLVPLKSATAGWKDLELWTHDSAVRSMREILHFNGNEYVSVKCNMVSYDETLAKPVYEPCQ